MVWKPKKSLTEPLLCLQNNSQNKQTVFVKGIDLDDVRDFPNYMPHMYTSLQNWKFENLVIGYNFQEDITYQHQLFVNNSITIIYLQITCTPHGRSRSMYEPYN